MAPLTEGRRSQRLLRASAAVGLVGLIAILIAIALAPTRALLAYLAAYTACTGVAVGALVLLLAGYATNARWLAPLRRVQEALASVFPLLAVLFLPIAIGVYRLYGWADPPADLPARVREAIDAKRAWLNPAGFVVRGFIYLAIFAVAAEVLRRWSLRRDAAAANPLGGDEAEVALGRERKFAAGMLVPVALAITFASVDWLMSLQPAWTSTMFPVYVFASGFSAGIAAVAIASAAMRARLALTPHHFHALGRMVFAFVVFWAYVAYFQGFLIQIADRPSEVTFFIPRVRGGWGIALWAIIALRFALPFVLLMPRAPKFWPRYVTAVSALILLGHVIESTWLVLPSAGVAPSPLDLIAYLGVGGTCVAFAVWRLHRAPLTVAGDPFLAAGLRYESPT